jgi:hypothetical protein
MIGSMRLALTLCLLLAACSATPGAIPGVPAGGGGGPASAPGGGFASSAGATDLAAAADGGCPVDLLAALNELVARVQDPVANRLLAERVRELDRPALAGASQTVRTVAVARLTGTVDDLARRGRLDPSLAAEFRDQAGCLQLLFNTR